MNNLYKNNLVKFPIGYHRFHKNKLYNFQLNRWYSLGYAGYEDMVEAGRRISSFSDWKHVMIELAEKSIRKQALMQAAFYYRAAEFYLLDESPQKSELYQKFKQLFYQAVQHESLETFDVPFQNTTLPAIKFSTPGPIKETIVLHGGFDSFMEEFFSIMKYFADHGIQVIAFEGPGQGAARRESDLAFDIEWEKPVKAILDYFNLNHVTILGISMGGWLCLRAAAFEPRIDRVIATGHAIDYMKSMPKVFYRIHMWFYHNHRDWMVRMARKKFLKTKESIPGWMVRHLMYITKKDEPMEALETYLDMNENNIHSERIEQDVLLLLGEKDHFIPLKMLEMQKNALNHARSVTTRLFMKKEHAENHCQTGNIGLSLDVMIHWLDQVTSPLPRE